MQLATWMQSNGIGDAELARLCGVDRATISRVRRRKSMPSWRLLAALKRETKGAVADDDFLDRIEAAE